jgi:hypothetical protein
MDGRPDACMHCGAPLVAAGRFCSNCGSPVAPVSLSPLAPPADAEAEVTTYADPYESLYARPANRPPAAPTAAPGPAGGPAPWLAATPPQPEQPEQPQQQQQQRPLPPPPAEPLSPTPAPSGGSVGPGLWIGAAVLLVAVLVLGIFLLLGGSGSDDATSGSTPLVPKPHPTSQPAKSQSTSAAPAKRSSAPAGQATEVAGLAQASAPRHAPPGVDFSGRTVTYVPANMVDGRADTCWRVSGDASGMVLTFRLAQPTRLSRVGMINGYDKIAYSQGRSYDWYAGNRRILSVEWSFDDGSTVAQQLGFSRKMQTLDIDPVTTRTVQVRIISVSPPGHGPAARNDTAVSEVSLQGVAG